MFDELCRASAGGPADYSGITYDRLDAGRRRVLALPGRRSSGHAAPVRGIVPHAERTCALPSGVPPESGGRSGRRSSAVSHDRARAGALPVGNADEASAGAVNRWPPSRSRKCIPPPRDGITWPTATRVTLTTRRGAGVVHVEADADDQGGHRLPALSLGREQSANRLTSAALDPTAGCRSSRSARFARRSATAAGDTADMTTSAPGRHRQRHGGCAARRGRARARRRRSVRRSPSSATSPAATTTASCCRACLPAATGPRTSS